MLNLKDFNPEGDGVTDDSAAFNAMFREAERVDLSEIVVPPGDYAIGSSVDLPYETGSAYKKLRIIGYGAILRTIANNVTIFRRLIPSVSPSPTNSISPTIEGFSFQGQAPNSAVAGTGINYQGASQPEFRSLYFSDLNEGLRTAWCMGMRIAGCNAQDTLNPYVISNGDGGRISDGTSTNSNSNVCNIESSRCQLKHASAVGMRFHGAGSCSVKDCIIEGSTADTCVIVTSTSESGLVPRRNFQLDNCWFEFTGAVNRMIAFETNKAVVTLEAMNISSGVGNNLQDVLIDATGSSRSIIAIRDTSWMELTGMSAKWFRDGLAGGNTNSWLFENNLIQMGEMLGDPAKWSAGVVPLNFSETGTFGYG